MHETIFIIGMHRSGTSCLAGSLQQYGLFLGKVFEENPHNLKGNRENAQIMELNERVLLESDGSWDNPPNQIIWNSNLTCMRDEIIDGFVNQDHEIWGFKDPRTLITLPFWLEGIRKFKFIGTFRNPESVAKSLFKRNRIPLDNALNLWKIYNEKLLELYEEYHFPLLSFDVPKEEYLSRIEKVSKYINLPGLNDNQDNLFFEESLRSDRNTIFDNDKYADIQFIYNRLINIYENQF